MSDDTQARIQQLIDTNKVMLFMKGTKSFPQCGFSNAVVQMLKIEGVPFETFNILADPALNERAYLLMKETQAAATARGHAFEDSHIKRQFIVTVGMGAYRPSSLIDYLDGREVEIDGIWGEPYRRGVAAGAHMPETAKLIGEIRSLVAARG